MERKDNYFMLIIIESLAMPFIIGSGGFLFASLYIFKVFILAIFLGLIYLIYLLLKTVHLSKQDYMSYIVFVSFTLLWNIFLVVPFIIYGFDHCPNCP